MPAQIRPRACPVSVADWNGFHRRSHRRPCRAAACGALCQQRQRRVRRHAVHDAAVGSEFSEKLRRSKHYVASQTSTNIMPRGIPCRAGYHAARRHRAGYAIPATSFRCGPLPRRRVGTRTAPDDAHQTKAEPQSPPLTTNLSSNMNRTCTRSSGVPRRLPDRSRAPPEYRVSTE